MTAAPVLIATMRDRKAELDAKIKERMDELDVLSARREEVCGLLLLAESLDESALPVVDAPREESPKVKRTRRTRAQIEAEKPTARAVYTIEHAPPPAAVAPAAKEPTLDVPDFLRRKETKPPEATA